MIRRNIYFKYPCSNWLDANNFSEDSEADDEEGIARVRRSAEFNDAAATNQKQEKVNL